MLESKLVLLVIDRAIMHMLGSGTRLYVHFVMGATNALGVGSFKGQWLGLFISQSYNFATYIQTQFASMFFLAFPAMW